MRAHHIMIMGVVTVKCVCVLASIEFRLTVFSQDAPVMLKIWAERWENTVLQKGPTDTQHGENQYRAKTKGEETLVIKKLKMIHCGDLSLNSFNTKHK